VPTAALFLRSPDAPLTRPLQLLRLVLQLSALLVLTRLLNAGVSQTVAQAPRIVAVPYSEFARAVRSNRVATVQVDGVHLLWQARKGSEGAAKKKSGAATATPQPPLLYSSTRPVDTAVPYDALLSNGATFGSPDKRGGGRLVTGALTLLYVGIAASFVARLPGMLGGLRLPGMPPGRGGAGARGGRGGRDGIAPPDVTFADVAGVDEAKEELEEVVACLKHPEKFAALGARPPAGVLLVGAPGTGKTLLARAVAGEAGVPFFSVAASEFIELYVGMGASRVREVFACARAAAPSIVFIDEIDAVAKGRSDGRLRGMGNDEREQTLNQLLTELDGFENGGSERGNKLVICLAATNRPDVLDAALRRPGRFDRTVAVSAPDRRGRQEILEVHVRARGCPLAPGVSLTDIAAATPGFTGADLAVLVNEAALLTARRGAAQLDADAFSAAVLRSVAGLERKRSLLFGAERGVVARHEAGHALVGAAVADLLPAGSASRAAMLSIVARSNGALGFAYTPPPQQQEGERALLFADELRGRLAVLMAGRAAEEATGAGRISTGASDDIARATELAYRAVAEFGLSPRIGPLNVAALSAGGGEEGLFGRDGSGATAVAVEAEVSALLKGAMAAAQALLRANAALLERLGATLEEEERMGGDRLAAFLADVKAALPLTQFVSGA
jgi:cell division protease FtsH